MNAATQAPAPEDSDWVLTLCQGIKEMRHTIMLLLLFLSSLFYKSLTEFEVQVKEKEANSPVCFWPWFMVLVFI